MFTAAKGPSPSPRVHPIQLSIVVPCYNEANEIEQNISRLKASLADFNNGENQICELLIVDGGSSDSTVERIKALGLDVICAPKGRAKQMNTGASLARGQYLLFLHSDTLLPSGLNQWLQALEQSQPLWGFFLLSLSGKAWPLRVVEFGINWRSRLTQVATGDQCQFVKRDQFKKLGGFADIDLMEDVELSKRLRRLGRPLVWSHKVVTSSRRWERRGIVKTVLLMWCLRLAFWLGVTPARLQRFYR